MRSSTTQPSGGNYETSPGIPGPHQPARRRLWRRAANRCPEQQIIEPARVTSELYLDRAELTIKVSETGGDLQLDNPPVFILAYSRTIDTATTVSITGENKQPVSQDSPEFASILAQVAADFGRLSKQPVMAVARHANRQPDRHGPRRSDHLP